jgi:hypothetical protein
VDVNGLEKSAAEEVQPNFVIRRERQTFRKLNRSKALLFVVHTSLIFVKGLPDAELKLLLDEVAAWSDDIAAYRERHVWAGWLEQEAKARGLRIDSLT